MGATKHPYLQGAATPFRWSRRNDERGVVSAPAAWKLALSEPVSSVAKREQLASPLDFCRHGDVLVVTKLDRLARSMTDLVAITSKLKAKGVELEVLAMNLDTSTPTGKLMLNLMGSFAELEREIMLERQREGVARAKAEGKYRGRVPTAQRKAGRWCNCGARA